MPSSFSYQAFCWNISLRPFAIKHCICRPPPCLQVFTPILPLGRHLSFGQFGGETLVTCVFALLPWPLYVIHLFALAHYLDMAKHLSTGKCCLPGRHRPSCIHRGDFLPYHPIYAPHAFPCCLPAWPISSKRKRRAQRKGRQKKENTSSTTTGDDYLGTLV